VRAKNSHRAKEEDMRSLLRVLVAIMLLLTAIDQRAQGEATINCPNGTIDILDWMTLDSQHRSTKHMAGPGSSTLYTTVWDDKYFWVKTPSGDTMDINLFDESFVYMWYTENEWHNPYDFRKHTYDWNMPMAPRCATGGYPGSTMTISDSSYSTYKNCELDSIRNVERVVFEVWGPYTAGKPGLESWRQPIGGDIPNTTPVYVISYRYGCNRNYTNCGDKEEYVLAQEYGLVRWQHFELVNGQYQLNGPGMTVNTLMSGTAVPFAPCMGQSRVAGESAPCEAWQSSVRRNLGPGATIEYRGPETPHPFANRFSPENTILLTD
jgi:hypothetical protein